MVFCIRVISPSGFQPFLCNLLIFAASFLGVPAVIVLYTGVILRIVKGR